MKRTKEELEEIAKQHEYDLDYLTCGGPIFQCKKLYTFTSDSIALAHKVNEEKIDTLVDLCSGSGVVGLEVVGIKNVKKAILVELQPKLYEMAKLSSECTATNTEIVVLNKDVKNLHLELPKDSADVVTCNPPYFKAGSGEVPVNISRAMARHEITLTIQDIIKTTSHILKSGGKFYLIHINSRIAEITKLLKIYNFKILESQVLSGKLERVIISAIKN